MSDSTVRNALRSKAHLVVVEAPAGCGKTHQGADYARDIAADSASRLLILTHTHAACAVFAERTKASGSSVEIRTVDSLIGQIAGAYYLGLDLPADTAAWARQNSEGYAHVALRVAALLRRHPMIAATLARRYPIVICDEHQDCSGDQHALSMAMLAQGSRVRVFGDPMQRIFRDKRLIGASPAYDWAALVTQSEAFEQLDTPHRWHDGCEQLGDWTLQAREILKAGGRIDLRSGLPPSVHVIVAENQARATFDYQLASNDRRPIDTLVKSEDSLLVLTRFNDTARSLRAFFRRRLPLWEGHTRSGLEALVKGIQDRRGNPAGLAETIVKFMNDVGKGFSPHAFGKRFEKEAREGCTGRASGKPAAIQGLARLLVNEADHRGVAKVLRELVSLQRSRSDFADIEVDCYSEFWEAVRLSRFDDAEKGLAEITHHRTHSHPKPPAKAISTIHKAKGLECGSVVLMPCDGKSFPDKLDARCLLYVALSRAKKQLLLVVSRDNQSPLLLI